jgi:transposase InsO family protein
LHRIHADTVGEVPTAGTGGERYFLTIVEEYSGYVEVVPVQQKSSIAQELIDVITRWERQTDSKVQVVRTDRGTEFLNKTFHGHCAENGIHTEMSAAYTPQQNGTAERMNRTIKEKARTLLLGVEADEGLWNEAVRSAVIQLNVTIFKDFVCFVRVTSETRVFAGCLTFRTRFAIVYPCTQETRRIYFLIYIYERLYHENTYSKRSSKRSKH